MKKAELIAKIAADADITKAAAEKVLDSFTAGVTQALKSGSKVTLVGFGTFSVSQRIARKGRNPQTGQVISIPEATLPRFKAAKSLRASLAPHVPHGRDVQVRAHGYFSDAEHAQLPGGPRYVAIEFYCPVVGCPVRVKTTNPRRPPRCKVHNVKMEPVNESR